MMSPTVLSSTSSMRYTVSLELLVLKSHFTSPPPIKYLNCSETDFHILWDIFLRHLGQLKSTQWTFLVQCRIQRHILIKPLFHMYAGHLNCMSPTVVGLPGSDPTLQKADNKNTEHWPFKDFYIFVMIGPVRVKINHQLVLAHKSLSHQTHTVQL